MMRTLAVAFAYWVIAGSVLSFLDGMGLMAGQTFAIVSWVVWGGLAVVAVLTWVSHRKWGV